MQNGKLKKDFIQILESMVKWSRLVEQVGSVVKVYHCSLCCQFLNDRIRG